MAQSVSRRCPNGSPDVPVIQQEEFVPSIGESIMDYFLSSVAIGEKNVLIKRKGQVSHQSSLVLMGHVHSASFTALPCSAIGPSHAFLIQSSLDDRQ